LAAAADDFFLDAARQRVYTAADAPCSVCSQGLANQSISTSSCGLIPVGTVFKATCAGVPFQATCTGKTATSAGMGLISPAGSASGVFTAGGIDRTLYVCAAGSSNGVAFNDVCQNGCRETANAIELDLGVNAFADCLNCTGPVDRRARGLRQAIAVVPGKLFVVCPCARLAGIPLTACCTTCFVTTCRRNNFVPPTFCACAFNLVVPCPSCDSSKDSNKLLLLLLLLLLLIPLLLCCLLLCCCFLRRKKKAADTHFSTFDPQAGSAIVAAPMPMPMCAPMPVCAPTACVMPTTGPCTTGFTQYSHCDVPPMGCDAGMYGGSPATCL